MAQIEAVLVNDTRVDCHHGCTRVIEAIHRLADANGIAIIAAAPAHHDWRLNPEFMRAFDRATLVIVNGEGSIHHNRPAAEPLLAAGALASARGKRSALINFSWFANDDRMAQGLKSFDIVSARESASVDAVQVARPDCRMVPDLSLYGSDADSELRSGIGFGDSVLIDRSRALLDACDRVGGTFVPIRYGSMFRLGRSFFSRDALTSPSQLRTAARIALAHARRRDADADSFVRSLAQLRLLVTGRFHGVTLAMCAHTPVLAVPSNTGKIEELLSDAGLDAKRLIDPRQLDRQRADEASRFSDRERRNVARYLTAARENAEALFRDLKALA